MATSRNQIQEIYLVGVELLTLSIAVKLSLEQVGFTVKKKDMQTDNRLKKQKFANAHFIVMITEVIPYLVKVYLYNFTHSIIIHLHDMVQSCQLNIAAMTE